MKYFKELNNYFYLIKYQDSISNSNYLYLIILKTHKLLFNLISIYLNSIYLFHQNLLTIYMIIQNPNSIKLIPNGTLIN